MRNAISKYNFRNVIPNYFIGGMGATWNTAELLAANYLNLDRFDILGFSVDENNNISCRVEKTHQSATAAFSSLSDLTYYVDADGWFGTTGGGSTMRLNSNLKNMYVPNLTGTIGSTGGFSLWNSNGFDKYHILQTPTTIYNTAFTNFSGKWLLLPSLTDIIIQSGTRINTNAMSNIERLYIPNCDFITWWFITNRRTSFDSINTGCIIYCHPDMETNAPSSGQIQLLTENAYGTTVTINGLTYTCVSGSTVEGEFWSGNNVIQGGANLAAAINSDTRTGTLADLEAGAYNGHVGVISTAVGSTGDTVTLSTAYPSDYTVSGANFVGGGGRNGAIAYAEDTRGCDIRYVDDFTLPDPPTALSASSISEYSFTLSFTEPTPNVNGTDGYQLWIDDKITPWYPYMPHDEILSGVTATTVNGLINGKKHTVKLRTFDGFYNLSEFSTELEVTTPQIVPASSLPLDDIISRYVFEDSVVDFSGTNDGSATSLTYDTGSVSKRGVFDGTASTVVVADSDDLSFTAGTPFSISCLASFSGTSDGWLINKRESSTTTNEWQLYYYQGNLAVTCFHPDGATYIITSYTWSPVADQVYHIAATSDGSSSKFGLRLFIDADLVGTPSEVGSYSGMSNTTSEVRMGRAGWSAGLYHTGTIDEMIIWGAELTPNELLRLSNEQLAGVDIGL
jgi:hypothetical protein